MKAEKNKREGMKDEHMKAGEWRQNRRDKHGGRGGDEGTTAWRVTTRRRCIDRRRMEGENMENKSYGGEEKHRGRAGRTETWRD